MQTVIGVGVGMVIGGGALWFITRAQAQTIRTQTQADSAADRARALESLAQKDREIAHLKTVLGQTTTKLDGAMGEIRTETARRSQAEGKLSHLADLQARLADREQQLQAVQAEYANLRARFVEAQARSHSEQQGFQEKLALLDRAQQEFSHTFKALSADALQQTNRSFIEFAEAKLNLFQQQAEGGLKLREQAIQKLVDPLESSLAGVHQHLRELEHARIDAYAGVSEQLKGLLDSQLHLQRETANLTQALRAPQVRGRWGEIQLKRVVEIAGMLEHCDFYQQETLPTSEGSLRPDMIIRLPNQRNIIVDSKAPLQAYLDSLEAQDDASRRAKLKDHARHIGRHLKQLSTKAYWDQLAVSPEFVVLFLPGEVFFSAALEQDPSLIEAGVSQRVILATPTTLIALLKAVAYGWQQDKIAENARYISELGQELYERTRTFTGHLVKMRKGLDSTVKAFNTAVGSFEARVLVSARRFHDFGVGGTEPIEPLDGLERTPRLIQGATPTEEE